MPIDRPDQLQIAINKKDYLYLVKDLAQLKEQDLLKKGVCKNIYLSAMDYYYSSTNLAEAADFAAQLNRLLKKFPNIEQTDKQLSLKYRAIEVYLRGCAMTMQEPVVLEKLFAKHVVFWIKWHIDLKERLERLLDIWIWGEKEFMNYRNARVNGFRSNEEKIGKMKIKSSADKEYESTVSNWLVIYDLFQENPDNNRSVADQVKFFGQSSDYLRLDATEKIVVKDIIQSYDMMRYLIGYSRLITPGKAKLPIEAFRKKDSAAKMVGKTERVGTGRVLPKDTKEKPLTLPATEESEEAKVKKIQSIYKGNETEEKEISNLQKQLAGQNAVQSLFEAVNNQDKNKTIAVLRLLAKDKGLVKVVGSSSQLNSMMQGYLQAKFDQDSLEQFKQNSNNPIYVHLFLRYLLKNKLGLSESESARQALHIANIYSSVGDGRYLNVAYGDAKSGDFKWTEVVKGDMGLEIKK